MTAPWLEGAIKAAVFMLIWVQTVPLLVWAERKVCAWMQDRTGPNRAGREIPVVGPILGRYGFIQPLADVIKFLFKEDSVPAAAHRTLFVLAPMIQVFTAIIAVATIPIGDRLVLWGREIPLVVADLDVGILWVFAIGSLAVYGTLLAGWSSANHYSFLGGLRSSAQIISYELGLTLSVVGVLLWTGSLRLRAVVEAQGEWMWNCWTQPIGCLVFLVAIFAETNRNPFDLPEAESELVAGYHTEYSSMRFAMFFMAEYMNMITMSALMVTLFFGGWQLPLLGALAGSHPNLHGLLSVAVFLAKTGFFLFLFIWARWTLPRFRYDQLMSIGWKGILPLALLQVVAASLQVVFGWAPYAVVMVGLLIAIGWFLGTPRTIRNVASGAMEKA